MQKKSIFKITGGKLPPPPQTDTPTYIPVFALKSQNINILKSSTLKIKRNKNKKLN
jgi:hypothetical protein